MIKSCVTIALVPEIKTGPWILWEDLERGIAEAAALGFDAIELFTPSADAVASDQLTKLLQKHNVALAAVGTGAGKVLNGLTLTDSDAGVRRQSIDFISAMMTFGAKFGSPAIIGSMQGGVSNGVEHGQALAWLEEGLNTLGKHAEKLGVTLIYEPLNRYETNLLNTLGAGAALLDKLETSNVKLLADLFHMNIEEIDIAETIREMGNYIGHVHFADSNRRPVGCGHTAMADIAKALGEINYSGYVSAEAFPWPNPRDAARQTITAFKQFFRTQ